jgi:hypothetical protein
MRAREETPKPLGSTHRGKLCAASVGLHAIISTDAALRAGLWLLLLLPLLPPLAPNCSGGGGMLPGWQVARKRDTADLSPSDGAGGPRSFSPRLRLAALSATQCTTSAPQEGAAAAHAFWSLASGASPHGDAPLTRMVEPLVVTSGCTVSSEAACSGSADADADASRRGLLPPDGGLAASPLRQRRLRGGFSAASGAAASWRSLSS